MRTTMLPRYLGSNRHICYASQQDAELSGASATVAPYNFSNCPTVCRTGWVLRACAPPAPLFSAVDRPLAAVMHGIRRHSR